MNFAVTILGSNSALPAHGRHPTAQVVTFENQLFLVDCGEGTQLRLSEYRIHRSRIGHIFISHLHGDHYLGLIGLLSSLGLQNRTQPLRIFAPRPLEQILQVQFDASDTRLPYPLEFTPLEPGAHRVILETGSLVVSAFPTDHRIDCFGFSFQETPQLRKLNPGEARAYGIPATFYKKLQQGEDYLTPQGERVENAAVTSDPPRGRRYVFCADGRYQEKLLDYIGGADLLYHEATYLQAETDNADRRYHSTSIQAATLARKGAVKKLLIGHFSSKYRDLGPFLEECRPVFPETELAMEGVTYPV